jgi:flagellar biosynthesis protein FliP
MQLARGRCVRAACVAALIVSAPPLAAQHISINFGEAFDRASGPLRGFMEKNVREKDLRLFVDIGGSAAAKAGRFVDARPRPRLHDVVASVLMSMG